MRLTAVRSPRARVVVFGLLLGTGLACSDSSSIGPGAVVTVRIAPDSLSIVTGKSDTLHGFPLDADGAFLATRKVSWTTGNAAVADVDSTGVLTAVGIGSTIITATAGGVSGTMPVVVTPAPVIGLSTDTVNLSAFGNSGATPTDTVTISNTGGGSLVGLAVSGITYGAGATGWLAANLNQPTAPAEVELIATLGALPVGSYSAQVSLTDPEASNSPTTITVLLDVTPGAATTIASQAGAGQTAAAGAAVAIPPCVLVTDQFGNPVSGVAVTFAVASGGGSRTGGAATTNASGIGCVGSWTLGTAVGANTLTATSVGLTGSPVTFTATATAAAAATIAVSTGNGQTAVAGQTVATPPAVLVADQFGNPVSGVSVTFAVSGGGGSLTGGAQTTNGSGIATVTSWTLGTTAGANSLSATSAGLTGSPVSFTATGTAGPATSIAINAGNNQTAIAGSAVATDPAVKVSDVNGNGVAGVSVTFSVTGGGGSVTGGSQVTNASGIATVTSWTLGGTVGANALDATAAGVGNVSFAATGLVGPAAILAKSAGDNQATSVDSTVPIDPAVLVTDINGNPVSGVSVTFSVLTGGGSITGGAQTTNASGIATLGSWTLGPAAGANTLRAASTGLTGSPLTFTATGNAGNATTIALNGGNGQTGTVGTTLGTALTALVTDNNTNPVASFTVSWSVSSGGGTVDCGSGAQASCSAATNASGISSVTWNLGTTPGAQTVTASAGGLAGSPVGYTATATVGAPTTLAKSAGDNQTATVNTAVATDPAVLITDQFGNPVSGVSVTFAVTGGGGSVAGGSATTNVLGIATVTSWTLGTTAGTGNNTLQASSAGLSSVSFSASATAGAATTVALSAGNGQTATVNTAVATDPAVFVSDAFGNAVSGIGVTFAVTGGGGSVTGGSQTSNASGIATVTSWTLGTTAGGNTLSATSAGLTGSPVAFSATGTAGAATQVAANSSTSQSATVNTAVAADPSVLVRDAFNNAVSGQSITFSITAGGGVVNCGAGNTTSCSVSTNASGVATVSSWTVGTTAGTSNNTLNATGSGLTGSPVGFTATANPGAVTTVAVFLGNNQTARPGATLSTDPSVSVTDAFGNGVCGATVTFAVTSGNGSVTGGSAVASCGIFGAIAVVGSWTLGSSGLPSAIAPANGRYTNTLQASSGSGSTTFTAFGAWSFASDVGTIFTANSQGSCNGCHSVGNFGTYTNIVNVPAVDNPGCGTLVVTTGSLANSFLYQKIQHTQACGGTMPQAAGNPFLTANERNIVRDWILNGAPNN